MGLVVWPAAEPTFRNARQQHTDAIRNIWRTSQKGGIISRALPLESRNGANKMMQIQKTGSPALIFVVSLTHIHGVGLLHEEAGCHCRPDVERFRVCPIRTTSWRWASVQWTVRRTVSRPGLPRRWHGRRSNASQD